MGANPSPSLNPNPDRNPNPNPFPDPSPDPNPNPLQRDAYTEAQWGRIENPAPPSADGEEGCGATTQGNATENATGSLGNAATLPNEEGSGPSGATPCFPGGCLSDGDCGGHGDCVRGVCECNGGYLGASLAEPCERPHPANGLE